MANQCTYIKENGERCGGYALTAEDLCFTHSPTTRDDRVRARSLGGFNKAETHRKASVIAKELLDRIIEVEAVAERAGNPQESVSTPEVIEVVGLPGREDPDHKPKRLKAKSRQSGTGRRGDNRVKYGEDFS